MNRVAQEDPDQKFFQHYEQVRANLKIARLHSGRIELIQHLHFLISSNELKFLLEDPRPYRSYLLHQQLLPESFFYPVEA